MKSLIVIGLGAEQNEMETVEEITFNIDHSKDLSASKSDCSTNQTNLMVSTASYPFVPLISKHPKAGKVNLVFE